MGQGARMTKCEQRINKCEASDQKIQRLKARNCLFLILQTTLLRTFFHGLQAWAGAVEVIDKLNSSLASA